MDHIFAFNGSCLDIVFGESFRQKMGKNCHQKCGMSLSFPVFAQQSCPLCHVHFVKSESLECKIKVPLGYYSVFY